VISLGFVSSLIQDLREGGGGGRERRKACVGGTKQAATES
jgi:hypothetical protein